MAVVTSKPVVRRSGPPKFRAVCMMGTTFELGTVTFYKKFVLQKVHRQLFLGSGGGDFFRKISTT